MKTGDLVQFREEERVGGKWFSQEEIRQNGIILGFDEIKRLWGRVPSIDPEVPNEPNSYMESHIEVLWNTGGTTWILRERMEVVK